MPHNAADNEIETLRYEEAQLQNASAEADGLIRQLLPIYACDFVVDFNVPIGQWYELPIGWQHKTVRVTVHRELLPRSHRGPVAVHPVTLRQIAASALA